jgi:alkaline phosphatase
MRTSKLMRYSTIGAAALALAACGGGGGNHDDDDDDDVVPPPIDAGPRPDAPSEAPPDASPPPEVKNIIFFLGDGMGVTTMTAARIYAKGEDGELTMDTLPETGWVRTYSNNALVTDSAPSMAAYMTGVKMNNEVVSMSPDTKAMPTASDNTINNCGAPGSNGAPVATFLEQAKAHQYATGVVTTTRVTHATPATTYAHICHRDLENDIAALADGVDVVFGGGRRHFTPSSAGGKRTDGRDLTAELAAQGYTYVSNRAGFDALDASTTTRAVGLFTTSHMSYELDRNPAIEPSLSEMTSKALAMLQKTGKPYFLVVEGGRIDHALHESNAKRALVDAVAFDNAIKAAIDQAKLSDPDLAHTLIVVTADHDHTLVMNGYAKRTGPTTETNAGILGLVRNVVTGAFDLDADGMPYTILGFGNGEARVPGARSSAAALDEATTAGNNYHQEAAVLMPVGGETHGGTDVAIMAIGKGSEAFHGFMTNTAVYGLLKAAVGF